MFNRSIETILLTIPAIIIGFSFHEYAHAFVSYKLGDPTPGNQGRLTLSPLAHIDIIGFILILLAGFGWAKPVQINPRYYKNPRRDEMIVSLAGPAMNLVVAFAFVVIYRLMINYYTGDNVVVYNLLRVIQYVVWINIILFFFNLIPLPPLDGFHILRELLPQRQYRLVWFLEQYSTIILLIIIVTPVLSYVILPPATYINDLFYRVLGL
jgi:Zn-dependent protease